MSFSPAEALAGLVKALGHYKEVFFGPHVAVTNDLQLLGGAPLGQGGNAVATQHYKVFATPEGPKLDLVVVKRSLHSGLGACLAKEAMLMSMIHAASVGGCNANIAFIYEVRCRDFVKINGRTFVDTADALCMKYYSTDLRKAILEPKPMASILLIMQGIFNGLSAGEKCGVAHRDLMPANVLLDAEGRAVITDYGNALRIGDPTAVRGPACIEFYNSPEGVEFRKHARRLPNDPLRLAAEAGYEEHAADRYHAALVVLEASFPQAFSAAWRVGGSELADMSHAVVRMIVSEIADPGALMHAPVEAPLLAACLSADPSERPVSADMHSTSVGMGKVEAAARRVMGIEDGEPSAADLLRYACDQRLGMYILNPKLALQHQHAMPLARAVLRMYRDAGMPVHDDVLQLSTTQAASLNEAVERLQGLRVQANEHVAAQQRIMHDMTHRAATATAGLAVPAGATPAAPATEAEPVPTVAQVLAAPAAAEPPTEAAADSPEHSESDESYGDLSPTESESDTEDDVDSPTAAQPPAGASSSGGAAAQPAAHGAELVSVAEEAARVCGETPRALGAARKCKTPGSAESADTPLFGCPAPAAPESGAGTSGGAAKAEATATARNGAADVEIDVPEGVDVAALDVKDASRYVKIEGDRGIPSAVPPEQERAMHDAVPRHLPRVRRSTEAAPPADPADSRANPMSPVAVANVLQPPPDATAAPVTGPSAAVDMHAAAAARAASGKRGREEAKGPATGASAAAHMQSTATACDTVAARLDQAGDKPAVKASVCVPAVAHAAAVAALPCDVGREARAAAPACKRRRVQPAAGIPPANDVTHAHVNVAAVSPAAGAPPQPASRGKRARPGDRCADQEGRNPKAQRGHSV